MGEGEGAPNFFLYSWHNRPHKAAMILRRISSHVKNENWFAVGLDFFIVVMGVLLGLQAQQWLGNRNAESDYRAALDRLSAELQANLDEGQRVKDELGYRLDRITNGLNALQSCSDTPEIKATIDDSLEGLMGTMSMKLHLSAINELTTDGRLLARQDSEMRREFTDLKRLLLVFQREANLMEELPLRERFENNPIIAVGERDSYERTYLGRSWTSGRRDLTLKVPVSEACKNDALVKSYYYWERWQGELLAMADVLMAELEPRLEKLKP